MPPTGGHAAGREKRRGERERERKLFPWRVATTSTAVYEYERTDRKNLDRLQPRVN